MKIVWKDVYEGNRNRFFPPEHLKGLIKETQKERLSICKNCPFNNTQGKINNFSTCTACGCPLKSKTACLHCECPKGYWLKQLTKEESNEIEEQLNQIK